MLLMAGFISRLNITEGRISELNDMTIETSQTEEEKDWKKTQEETIE